MKRLIVFICALAISLLAGCVPVFAASLPHYSCYYPVSVEETIGGNCEDCRIVKVYQMGANADPSGIPTEDFERYGCTYHLLDITRRDEIGIAKMPWTKPVSESCETSNPQEAAAKFQQEIEVSTEDGYSGTLRLDRDSVQVEADGYATKKQEITSMRTYSNLSAANPALLPQTIEENGNILSLGDVEWTEAWQTESSGAALRYSASASYKGTVDIPYATMSPPTIPARWSSSTARWQPIRWCSRRSARSRSRNLNLNRRPNRSPLWISRRCRRPTRPWNPMPGHLLKPRMNRVAVILPGRRKQLTKKQMQMKNQIERRWNLCVLKKSARSPLLRSEPRLLRAALFCFGRFGTGKNHMANVRRSPVDCVRLYVRQQ